MFNLKKGLLQFLPTLKDGVSLQGLYEYNCPIDDLIGNMMLSIIIGALLLGITISMGNEPRAIDVYRNKTELEITSVNGVPRDTVVVWKNN